jgi:hypothetical protein
MCTELLPPGGYPTAVNKIYIISYHTIYHIKLISRGGLLLAFAHEKGGPQNVKIFCGGTYTEENKNLTQCGGCSFEDIRFQTAYKEYKSNTPDFD